MFSAMKYVYEVYKEKSFTKAAQNLYISQPSLSSNIKKIEAKIGAPLFDRNTIPVRLTECGEEYIKCVEQMMEIENHFIDYLYSTKNLQRGRIAIGGSQFFISFVLPSILQVFKTEYPQVDVVISEASSVTLEFQLFNGTLDLAIDSNMLNDDIYEHFLFRNERLILAVPTSHEINRSLAEYQLTAEDILADRHCSDTHPVVPIQAFTGEPFILLGPGNDSRKRADLLFSSENLVPTILVQPEQQFTAYTLAETGMGATIISDTLLHRLSPSSKLVFYKLPDNVSHQSVYFYYKRNKYITPAMRKFMDIARGLM